ncbi:type II CRISPR-associated endonuclease Cas1 [Clostridium perfringens]
MSWRYVYISKAEKISLHLDSLKISNANEDISIPLNEVNSILIDSYSTELTVRLLARLSEYKIVLIVCDVSMMPIGVYTVFSGYHKGYKIQKVQIELSEQFKGELWKCLIKEKLRNQHKCLYGKFKDKDMDIALDTLSKYSELVENYDSTNREGLGARVYFKALFGDKFSRNDDSNSINSFLNFGYAIIRSSFCRAIVIHGLNPSFGIFHRNEFNSFNLADDLMEIYRPIIDEYIYCNFLKKDTLDRKDKLSIINILNYYIMHNGEKINIATSIEKFVISYINAIKSNNINMLSFPEIAILEEYEL